MKYPVYKGHGYCKGCDKYRFCIHLTTLSYPIVGDIRRTVIWSFCLQCLMEWEAAGYFQ